MNILGITHGLCLHSSAALLIDGEIVSINEEERFARIKHATCIEGGLFPKEAITECLTHGNLKPQDIDLVCVSWGESRPNGWHPALVVREEIRKRNFEIQGLEAGDPTFMGSPDPSRYGLVMEERTLGGLADVGITAKIEFYNHHLSHAASTYFCSGYQFSNIISLDGAGDTCAGWIGFSEAAFSNPYSLEASTAEQLSKLGSQDWFAGSRSISQTVKTENSWGILWADVTNLLGFGHQAEGKTMGLASYGEFDPDILPPFFNSDGTPDLYRFSEHFMRYFGLQINAPYLGDGSFPDGAELDPVSKNGKNLAYTLQKYYNAFLTEKAKMMVDNNGCKDFCLAGGVALNCTGNGHLSNLDFVNNVFVQPASGDNGTALGAAILGSLGDGWGGFSNNFNHAYWGSYYTDDEIEKALESSDLEYEKADDAPERVAELLFQDKVVCNFQGRAEIGPRALGNRSILANPCIKENLNRINKMKGRESWRPLAPSILEENYSEVVISKQQSPYMLMAVQVVSEWREKIPAVVHVDGSCRPQTVLKSTNPFYHDIILKFKEKTSIPVVLNTSYNMYHEPIVNSPHDAIKSFVELGADALCIGNFIARTKTG